MPSSSLEPPHAESDTTSAAAAHPIKNFRTVRLLFRGLMGSDDTAKLLGAPTVQAGVLGGVLAPQSTEAVL